MKVLVTGFDPFGGEAVNPAYEAVKLLPDRIEGAEIIRQEIPTVFFESEKVITEAIRKHRPDVVICVGQAGGRSCVTLEQTAVNLAEAGIPDNQGNKPMGEKLKEDGETAYFTSLPVHAAVERVRKAGLPCHISYTAGTYVCNALMYHVLYLSKKEYPDMRAGFVHVPFICEQVVEKPNGTPSMALTDIVRSLQAVIEASVLV
ncbi:MAG: pyroglutamyl-peptidase I [Clostridiales bacterium]|nr:pyroglutamyl-peptidase I [Clostridiales bacterium]